MKALYRQIKTIGFLLILFLFFLSLPSIFNHVYGNIEPSKDLVYKPKVKFKFTTNNSLYTIDAKDKENWVYFSFSEGSVIEIDDHVKQDWDIAFNRANFISNGGATNPKGNVGLINLGAVDIGSVKKAPEQGYVQDSNYFGLNRNRELKKWYIYKTKNHTLISKKDVYIIHTSDGKYAKMRILDYYCKDGSSACITIEYYYQPDGSNILKNINRKLNSQTVLSSVFFNSTI